MTRQCFILAKMIEYDRSTRQIGGERVFRLRYCGDDLSRCHVPCIPVEVDEQKPGMGSIPFVKRDEVVAVRGEDGSSLGFGRGKNGGIFRCIAKLLDRRDHVVASRSEAVYQFTRVQAFVNGQAQRLARLGDALPPPRLRATCRYALRSQGLPRSLRPVNRTRALRRRLPAGLPLSARRAAQP